MYSILLIITGALVIPGIIIRTRSLLSGRKGPGMFQPWHNLLLLARKGSVFSRSSGLIQQAAPSLMLSSILAAALLVPGAGKSGILSFPFDFVVFAGLMALSRFLLVLAALDAGSSFEGMGASREALYGILAEPSFFMLTGALAVFTGHDTFSSLFNALPGHTLGYYAATLPAMYVLFIIMIIETGRIPVDDPRTHLELTMIHEVMVLDLSGIDLAILQLAGYIKFGIFSSLIAACATQASWSVPVQLAFGLAVQGLNAVSIGVLESFRARNRMNKNPQYILAITAVSLLIFMLAILTLI